MKSRPIHFGLTTTPQVHFLTEKAYSQGLIATPEVVKATDYNEYFAISFSKFTALLSSQDTSKYERKLVVDCANGVGAVQFKKLIEFLGSEIDLEFEFINDNVEDPKLVNEHCGAEHV